MGLAIAILISPNGGAERSADRPAKARWCAAQVETTNWQLIIDREQENQEKLAEIQRLVKDGVPMRDIWENLGFSSLSQYRHFVRRHLNVEPGTFRGPSTLERVKRAEALLVEGKFSTAEIIRGLGYNSYQAFNNAFHRVHGKSPRRWLAENASSRRE